MKYLFCGILLCLSVIAVAQSSTGGLVAHYDFNNDAIDKSTNSNNGTITGGVTPTEDRFGNPCGALHFNGTDGFISVPNSASLKSPTSSFSFTGWFKIEKSKTSINNINLVLFSKSSANTKAQYCFILNRTFGDPHSSISLNSDFIAQDENYNAHPIEFNQWYFLAVVYEESWVNIFLNDKLITQSIVKRPFTPNDFNLEIGRDAAITPKYFSGCLDDLRIYNRALSPMEVTSLFNIQPGKGTMENLSANFPTDIEKNTDAGKCHTAVSFTEPTATSGCGKVELKQVAGLSSGSLFGAGHNLIVYEAVLPSGKKLSDTFQITVIDKEPPVFSCPADITTSSETGSKGTIVDYPIPVATDNCKNTDIDLVGGPTPGANFPLGTTTVRYKATDDAGNTADCSFQITVVKKVQRVLHCTNDTIVYTKPDAENAAVTFEKPYIVIDGIKTNMKKIQGLPRGSLFPLGKTEQTYEFIDTVLGNMTCSFNIVVKDITAPNIQCPPDVKAVCEAGEKRAVINYLLPKATDNGFIISVRLVSGYPAGNEFPVGVTLVTYEAEDKSGNKSNCSFKVTVEEKKAVVIKPVEQPGLETKQIKPLEEKPAPVVIAEAEQTIKQPQKPFTPPATEQKPKAKIEDKPAVNTNTTTKDKVREAEKSFFPNNEVPEEEMIKLSQKPIITFAEVKEEKPEIIVKTPATVTEKKEEKAKDTSPVKSSAYTRPIVIECNDDILRNADPGKCGTVVNYDAPAIRSGDGVNITRIKGNASGSFFKSGTTVNTFSATDGQRVKECSFKVVVKEDEAPVFNCPSDTTIILPINRRGIVYYYRSAFARVGIS